MIIENRSNFIWTIPPQPGDRLYFVNCHHFTVADVEVYGARIELLSCTNARLEHCNVRGQHKSQICYLIQGCTHIELYVCYARDAVTLSDTGGEGHAFQILDCSVVWLRYCVSIATRPQKMEDHYSLVNSHHVRLIRCLAKGPTRQTGTAYCVDEKSHHCGLLRCSGRNLGYGGLTIYAAHHVAARRCEFQPTGCHLGVYGTARRKATDIRLTATQFLSPRVKQSWVDPKTTRRVSILKRPVRRIGRTAGKDATARTPRPRTGLLRAST